MCLEHIINLWIQSTSENLDQLCKSQVMSEPIQVKYCTFYPVLRYFRRQPPYCYEADEWIWANYNFH